MLNNLKSTTKLKANQLSNKLKTINLSKLSPQAIAGLTLCLAIITIGYSFISNIKSNQQASAEQIASSPESGVKSRINELYDTLKARNLGSDTDLSSLDVINDDWGSKWNRIKTSALRPNTNTNTGTGVSANGCIELNPNDPEVNFTDHTTCKQWSHRLTVVSGQPTSRFTNSGATWSWDASGTNNRAVGNKTAIQLCESLGNGWRLPTKGELFSAYSSEAGTKMASQQDQYSWSSTEFNATYAYLVRWSDGHVGSHHKPGQCLVSCVR